MLRETSNSDVEVVAVFPANMADEVNAVLETALDSVPFSAGGWWVTAQS